MNADLIGGLTSAGVAAHDAIGEGESEWLAWSFDLPVLIPGILLGVFYARGLRRWPVRSRPHPWWMVAFFYSGLLVGVLSVVSPIDSLGSHHFFMHMIQHELIMLVAVPLILLGAPVTPVLRGMPRWLRVDFVGSFVSEPATRFVWRWLTQPLVALLISQGVVVVWHLFPGWYEGAVRHEGVHYLQHFSFAFGALLFWWNIIDPAPLHAPMGYLLRMAYVLAGTTAQAAIAAMITLADEPLYEVYLTARPIFDLSPLSDQELGGLVMWVPGQMIHLGVMGALFAVWATKSEQRQREVEAREGGSQTVAL
ncbi:MAG: cytochrome c oxidase assembly protein [Dehalococcoidia bacterium]